MRKLILVGIITLAATPAFAQPRRGPAPAPYGGGAFSTHRGFMGSVGLGLGSQVLSCDTCGESSTFSGLAVDFSLGGFINPRLAILFDANMVMHFEEFNNGFGGSELIAFTNSVSAIAARYWVSPVLSIKGGAGVGRYVVSSEADSFELGSGLGITGAINYELMQKRTGFAIDAQLRLASVFYNDGTITNVAGLIGFNWF